MPVDANRAVRGSVGGRLERLGDRDGASGCGETSRADCGCSCCAAVSQIWAAGAWSGSGDGGFDGARRWKRRCDSIVQIAGMGTRLYTSCYINHEVGKAPGATAGQSSIESQASTRSLPRGARCSGRRVSAVEENQLYIKPKTKV